jgi:hypothetical protein
VSRAALEHLRAVADGLAQRAAEAVAPTGIDEADLRWAAARAAVACAARAAVQRHGLDASGALFAAPAANASRRRACALVGDAPAWPLADVPSFLQLGDAYPHLLPQTHRKHQGAWFTAPELAAATAARTLAPLTVTAPLRIVDPAVGAGSFLRAALAWRVSTGHRARTVAATELFGLDLDETAAQLAAWSLHEACLDDAPPIAAIEANVRQGDGLLDLEDGTFDAVVGNPPWETLQVARRDGLVAAAAEAVAARAARLREHFHSRGRGKVYTYRLFVERALRLLRDGGRLGLIVPASLWFDRDAQPLRRILLDGCRWEWLFAFDNRRRLFAIDGRYRFGAVVATKGGRTDAVRAAFLRSDPTEWARAEPPHLLYRAADVRSLSPHSGAFVEVRSARDLELLQRCTAHGEPLLGARGACVWRQGDLNMTGDRHRFVRRGDAERDGYRAGRDGRWRRGPREAVLRPLYQGGMVALLHTNAGAYAGGEGRAVRWRAPADPFQLQPQYLVDAAAIPVGVPARVALRALSNATNERTAIACLLADEPCGNSLGVLTPRAPTATPLRDTAFVAGVLASLVWDWALRQRLGGTNVNGFVLADTVLPRATEARRAAIARLVLPLSAVLPWHAALFEVARSEGWWHGSTAPCTRDEERRGLYARLDLEVAAAFSLDVRDLEWMLRETGLPTRELADRRRTQQLDPKGFWRVDRWLEPAARLPQRILALARSGALPSSAGEHRRQMVGE